MGNRLGAERGPAWEPNIPVEQQQPLNDLNNPRNKGVWDTLINYTLPLMCMAALAYTNYKNKIKRQEEEKAHELEIQEILRYKNGPLKIKVDVIEQEEDKLFQEKLEKVKYYDKGLETILDIKCSVFKPRLERESLQDELVNKLFHAHKNVSDVIKYDALRDVYVHDWKFCGFTKETNGKLRHLYSQNWKLQLELQKYKNILEKVKTESDSKH